MKKACAVMMMAMILAAGCAKKPVKKEAAPQQPIVPGAEDTLKDEPSIRFTDWQRMTELKIVNFDYDKSDLTATARQLLQQNADFLKKHDEVMVLVEGHCDERGTTEYNLALGQRRAMMVREYYGKLGVPLSQVGTISYGKEKPTDERHTEEAWALNRRAETKVRARR